MTEKKQSTDTEKRDIQVRIWFSQSELDLMDKHFADLGLKSRSDFIRDAIHFYIGYLNQQKNIDYLSPVLGSVIKSEIDGAVRNISEMLFKMAVEESLLSNMIAFSNRINPENLAGVRQWCEREVAETNGVISYERAYEVQCED